MITDAFRLQLGRILKMFNGSLMPCIFPTAWKEGTIIPLPKMSIPKTASDMHPIALLPLPGNIDMAVWYLYFWNDYIYRWKATFLVIIMVLMKL